jgi:carbon monoxide dehydrogenase subunit G
MIRARADATVPVPPVTVFASVIDLDHADWLPAVRRLRRLGPQTGVGSRYAVEVGILGRHLSGVLVCRELTAPRRAVYVLEDGLDLSITLDVRPVSGGSQLAIEAQYSLGGSKLSGAALERASAGAARREVARAVEQLAARFVRSDQTRTGT